MGRTPRCEKVGVKKGPWAPQEDHKLLAYVDHHGHGNWRALPSKAGLERCGKSCRLRWTNYLRPDIKRGKFTLQEDQTIIQLHALLGNRWSAIATHLPKRTDNEIKNYWNTHLKKKLTKMGIDPVTHKPKKDALFLSNDAQSKSVSSNISHMAQWESARLEAEARLASQSKQASSCPNTNNIIEYKDGLKVSMPTAFSSGVNEINNSQPMGSYNQGFTELLLCNVKDTKLSSESNDDAGNSRKGTAVECCGSEDNKKYWNCILNLLNSSPSTSPLF